MDFVALDFETATEDRASACAVGLAFVEDGQLQETRFWLVRPPGNEYAGYNIEQIHRFDDHLLDAEYFWHWKGWDEDPNVRWIGQLTEPVPMFHVRLGRHSITLPGVGAEKGFYKDFAERFSSGEWLKADRLIWPWPLTLVAQLDFSIGENRGRIASAREKVWPHKLPR